NDEPSIPYHRSECRLRNTFHSDPHREMLTTRGKDGNELRITEGASRTPPCPKQIASMDDICAREKRMETNLGLALPVKNR
ncbi:hypothetical protein KIN20_023007, partial [Parelaphostrongylus tenuis]